MCAPNRRLMVLSLHWEPGASPTGFPRSGLEILVGTDSLGLSSLDFRFLHLLGNIHGGLCFPAHLPTGQLEVNASLVP